MTDWFWLQRSLPTEFSGADLWEALYANEPITVLLESPATVATKFPSKLARYSIAAGKPRQIWVPPVGEILPCLELLRSRMQPAPNLKQALKVLIQIYPSTCPSQADI